MDLFKVSGVDVKAAITRCGSAIGARDVMRDFWQSIDERAALIEKYEQENDIGNYTIYVHGLKSSARAIGALDLSEKAEYLEECGNNGNIDEIRLLTPSLLSFYRKLYRSENQQVKITRNIQKPYFYSCRTFSLCKSFYRCPLQHL